MVTGLLQSCAMLLFTTAILVTDWLMMRRYDPHRPAGGSGRNWPFMLFVLALVLFLLAQPIVWPWLGVRVDAGWGLGVQLVGMVIAAAAVALNYWARQHLGEFYAQRGEVQPNHRLVDTGPYAFVRHPIFTAYFMIVIGLLLVNPAFTTLLIAVYAFVDFGRHARRDERLLLAHLSGYEAYMARTPRFVPALAGYHARTAATVRASTSHPPLRRRGRR